jgi:hypothetical protein
MEKTDKVQAKKVYCSQCGSEVPKSLIHIFDRSDLNDSVVMCPPNNPHVLPKYQAGYTWTRLEEHEHFHEDNPGKFRLYRMDIVLINCRFNSQGKKLPELCLYAGKHGIVCGDKEAWQELDDTQKEQVRGIAMRMWQNTILHPVMMDLISSYEVPVNVQ